MARKGGLVLCFVVFTNIFYIDCADFHPFENGYVKNGNAYEAIYGTQTNTTHPPGYVETVSALLRDYRAGKIAYEALNTFKKGLEEYFLFRFYTKYATDLYPTLPELDIDPYALPDYSDETISFNNVQVYGYPALKKRGVPNVSIEGLGSSLEYEVKASFKSDAVIFLGNFELYNSTYFFVYTLKQATLSTHSHSSRELTKGKALFIQDLLSFGSEELLHTYDSSYDRYTEANELFVQHFNKVLAKTYLSHLSKKAYTSYRRAFLQYGEKFTSSYQKLILAGITESFIEYVKAKGLNSFEVKPINFTSGVGPREYVQAYKDIKVDGALNFVSHELVNSTFEYFGENNTEARVYDAIDFIYPNDGEKQAFVSFVISDGRHENSKKFKINSIQIIFVYKLKLVSPYVVHRDKEVFFNGSGFLIKFRLDNFDPSYEFLIRHIGNDIARAFEQTLGD